MAELLLELFSEEIPAGAQIRAAEEFKNLFASKLDDNKISYDSIDCYTTPRRVCVVIAGLPVMQEATSEEKRGPRVDAPSKAIEGFLKSTGLTLDQLEKRTTPKGEFYFSVIKQEGRAVSECTGEIAEEIVNNYTWAKSMKWGAHDVRWIRPLHSIICLFDGKVLPISFGHIKSGDKTRGHRFLGADEFKVKDFVDYEKKLKKHYVVLRQQERQDIIRKDIARLADGAGAKVKPDDGLVAEVANLVEWPVALLGKIEKKFLDVPQEALILTMRSHQKYFSLLNENGEIAPYFITVSNMIASDKGAQIISGNERVLRARLEDAKFFWDQDRKRSLESRIADLDKVVFHAKLGTVRDKTERVAILAREISEWVPNANPDLAERAAKLCKADLTTEMVGELTELQGFMGSYYAAHDGEDKNIVAAIGEHYSPVGSSDSAPTNPTSVCVAIADKVDTLAGLFSIGEKPTGSRDPFALRRAALGVIRIILENDLRVSLNHLFGRAIAGCSVASAEVVPLAAGQNNVSVSAVGFGGGDNQKTAEELTAFFADRLRVLLKDQNIRYDIIEAVFNDGADDDLTRMVARAKALVNFLKTEDGENLLAAYKRATNIVQIEEKKDKKSYSGKPDEARLVEAAEKNIYIRFSELRVDIKPLLEDEKYEAAMQKLATLREPVDAFFDGVKVNDNDPKIRKNRLLLLSQFRELLNEVANFSKLEG